LAKIAAHNVASRPDEFEPEVRQDVGQGKDLVVISCRNLAQAGISYPSGDAPTGGNPLSDGASHDFAKSLGHGQLVVSADDAFVVYSIHPALRNET
jgi:hypothetical protein